MALQFSFHTGRPINIILKDHVIRFVEVKQEKPLIIQKFGERYLPSGLIKDGRIINFEALELIMEECLTNWKIKNRRVQFHVPDSVVVIRKVTIPADVADDEIEGYLYMEIGTSIHLPFEDPVFDFTIVRSGEGEKEIILFAAPEEVMMDYRELFEGVKLTPVVADISPLSMYRMYYHLKKSAITKHVLVVQIDLNAVNLCIFENHLPVFMRHIAMDVDGDQWNYPLISGGNATQITYKGNKQDVIYALEDMYKEIVRVLDFYRYTLNKGKQRVTKLFVDVDHPWKNEIMYEITQRIDVPAESIERQSVPTATDSGTLPETFQCAAGLGLKGV